MEKKHILVFAPHPDDEILGCGGSICKYIRAGESVKVVYMTRGENGVRNAKADVAAQIRQKEAASALACLGEVEIQQLGLKDGFVWEGESVVIQMIDIIRQFRPERIYLPYAKDQHPDHQNTYQMVVKAARYASFSGFAQCQYKKEWQTKELLCYEIWTPMEHVDFTEDITEYIEDKRRAMREHKSQLEKRDYDAALLGLNRYRGVISKKGKYCEAFKIVS